MMGMIGAALALSIGPLIDRLGAKRMLLLGVALVGIHAFIIAQTQHLWQNTAYVRVMLSLWVMLLPVVTFAVIALPMAICSSTISATQFAIYMSVANLGSAAGSKIYGMVSEQSSFVQSYSLLGTLAIVMIAVLIFHRHHDENSATASGKRKATRKYTVGIAGSGAGAFWSGAMRCPKCRADMEPVEYEGTEIDRCTICNGIWFDAGEIDVLRDKQAAAAIDTGDASTGKQSNAIDRYQCPRCSGDMLRVVDPRQTHIWYETCGSCNGSFLDAGELRDLSTVTITDFFKGLVTPERK
jgi:Zn-finger nucleic acid-binding protein